MLDSLLLWGCRTKATESRFYVCHTWLQQCFKTNRPLRHFHTDLYTNKRKCNFGPVLYKENPEEEKRKRKEKTSQNRLMVKQQGLGPLGGKV